MYYCPSHTSIFSFFFNDTATTEIYTLSLHDALPISCLSYSKSSGLDPSVNHVIMRFSNVYGSERDLPERVIPKFMNKALRGEDITLYGGEQILDFTFIDDTISGIMKLVSSSLEGDGSMFG